MMPAVTKDPREWTLEERWTVITNRLQWIQLCLDYYEEEQKNKRFLDFVEGKANVTSRLRLGLEP